MGDDALIHKDLSFQTLGALFDTFNEIGYGHRENVYQKTVAAFLKNRGVPFQEQVKVDVVVLDERVGTYFLDFLIDDRLILELKTGTAFRTADFRQTQAYLKSTKLLLAIVAAFTPNGVRFRRVLNLY